MKKTISIIAVTVLGISALFTLNSCNEQAKAQAPAPPTALPASPTASPEGAKAYFISPKDGDTVGKTFTVHFGLKGMGVAPAGLYLEGVPTGHHHLVVDAETPNLKLPFPKSENYLHFGGGQTEAEITLAPGTHKLQMVLGDHFHVPHDPPVMSEVITITVE